jgi:hypothetical protein
MYELSEVHLRVLNAIAAMAGGCFQPSPLNSPQAVLLIQSWRFALGPDRVTLSAMLRLAEVLYQGGEMNNGETQSLSRMLYHLGCDDVVVQLLAKGVSIDDVLEVVQALRQR